MKIENREQYERSLRVRDIFVTAIRDLDPCSETYELEKTCMADIAADIDMELQRWRDSHGA